MQKVLITGGAGLLGINWAIAIKKNYDVILGLHNKKVVVKGIRTAQIDLEDINALRKDIASLSPDIIVHTAGMANVDECEKSPESANYINSELARNVAVVCRENDIYLIHISTDHLFNGAQPNATEKKIPDPVNVYASSKLNGERLVAESCPDALIVRTNFFGWGGPYKQSFSDWILSNLKEGKKIKLFEDVFYTPILIDRLAVISMDFSQKNIQGVVNIVGDDRISKYNFGIKIAKQFGLKTELIEKGTIDELSFLTLRPKDMSLSNKYARRILGKKLGDVEEYLLELKHQEDNGRIDMINNAFAKTRV